MDTNQQTNKQPIWINEKNNETGQCIEERDLSPTFCVSIRNVDVNCETNRVTNLDVYNMNDFISSHRVYVCILN